MPTPTTILKSEGNSNGRPISSENSTVATKLKKSKQQSRDTMHLITALCFVTCTTFWLASLFLYHPNAWWVIQNAFVTLAVCFVAETTVGCLAPSLETRLVLMHFSLGWVQNIVYIFFVCHVAKPLCRSVDESLLWILPLYLDHDVDQEKGVLFHVPALLHHSPYN